MNAPLPQVKALSYPSEVKRATPEQQLDAVEALMHRIVLGDGGDLAGEMAHSQVASGGKRVRARVALQACRCFGVSDSAAVHWAAAIELLHNATLVHDDIQDGDTVRRGEPTVWAQWGVAQGINAGDFLLMQPFMALAGVPGESQGPLSMTLADYATRTVRGQVEEIALKDRGDLSMVNYLKACEGKTGALLALPVVGAALLGGRSLSEAERLAMPFVQLGVLFQLQDDVIDLYGEKGRGETGCDIREGKVSALLLAHLERFPEHEKELLQILNKEREMTTSEDVALVGRYYEASQSLDVVLGRIRQMRDQVLESLPLRQEPRLRQVAEKLVKMALAPIASLLLEPVR